MPISWALLSMENELGVSIEVASKVWMETVHQPDIGLALAGRKYEEYGVHAEYMYRCRYQEVAVHTRTSGGGARDLGQNQIIEAMA